MTSWAQANHPGARPDALRTVFDQAVTAPVNGNGEGRDEPQPRFRSLKEFCAEYTPIAHIVDGLICSRSLYTLTARTGVGKTAFLVSTALAIATGRSEIINRNIIPGRVVYCTAENPDGLRMRLAVASFHWNVDQATVSRRLIVSDNRIRPEEIYNYLGGEA